MRTAMGSTCTLQHTVRQDLTCQISGSSRHWIIAMTTPGMTAENTAKRQVETFERAMLSECFKSILGTCWGETARWTSFQWRQTDLIKPDKEYKRCNGNLLQLLLEVLIGILISCHCLWIIYPNLRKSNTMLLHLKPAPGILLPQIFFPDDQHGNIVHSDFQ